MQEHAVAAWVRQTEIIAREIDVAEFDAAGLRAEIDALRGLTRMRIEDALDVLQSAMPAQTYHLPHGVELCILPPTFRLRLHGAARPRSTPKRWGVEASRV